LQAAIYQSAVFQVSLFGGWILSVEKRPNGLANSSSTK
jgi:hypothetical protein